MPTHSHVYSDNRSIVREQLRKDIQNAVKKENEFHTFTTGVNDISDN